MIDLVEGRAVLLDSASVEDPNDFDATQQDRAIYDACNQFIRETGCTVGLSALTIAAATPLLDARTLLSDDAFSVDQFYAMYHDDIQIDLGQGLTRRETIVLFNSARHCEVQKLLKGEMRFDYALAELD